MHPRATANITKRLNTSRSIALMIVLTVAGASVTAHAAMTFNRPAAVAYAAANYNKVVGDGYFWINSSTCQYYGAGATVPTGSGIASGVGDDCAHFVSSCIGTPSGAGIAVQQPFATSPVTSYKAQYGNPSASGLTNWLLGGYATQATSVAGLTAGDVISYDWTGNGSVDHTVLYIGNGQIAAHATSHYGVAWNWSASSYPNEKLTFVHITVPDAAVPEPALLSSLAGVLLLSLRRQNRPS